MVRFCKSRLIGDVVRTSLLLAAALAATAHAPVAQANAPAAALANPRPILWIDPIDIKERNLYYGPGGREHQPREPFTFLKEDKEGTNPKFDVRDAAGTKWKAKLGIEAQPETVASRLLWAVGFVANENYLVEDVKIEEMPRLNRGRKLVERDGRIHWVRLQKAPRDTGEKLGRWKWKHNPFKGTREFNGLRIMMALINNWDLKDSNTAIYAGRKNDTQLYEVSDLGSSFGRTGQSYRANRAKNNLPGYQHSKFISKVTREYVSFDVPSHLSYVYIFRFTLFISEKHQRWIGQRIPRADVKWMASLLSQLSPEQIRDAFRAGGYSPGQVEAYAATVEARIAELNRLSG